MPFNSPLFLFAFGPAFFVIFYATPSRYRNVAALLLSVVFYAWAEPLFIFVVLASSLADYWLVGFFVRLQGGRLKRALATLAVAQGVSILLYFKYAAFLYRSLAQLTGFDPTPPGLLSPLLPLAVSFVTFEKVTYVVDNYRGIGRPASSLLNYLTYVFLFPKLIAGPIVKYHDIEPYLDRHTTGLEDFRVGLLRFALGLAKKVLIADNLSATVDAAFQAQPNALTAAGAWLGVVCFSFQIYFDFSGYSDMAIGMARMMGFPLRENFNQPYLSKNFTEFWRRWHISLSSWIREYLYIPLGGNRVPQWRLYVNLVVCFALSGLWHGANWTFLIWGLYHGFFLAADRIGLARLTRALPDAINIGATFLLVSIGWVLFRSPDIHHGIGYLHALIDPARDVPPLVFLDQNVLVTLLAACVLSFVPYDWIGRLGRSPRSAQALETSMAWAVALAFVWSGSRLVATTFIPFLYFRF